MSRAILNINLLLLTLCLCAAEPEYSRNVIQWQEIAIPPESEQSVHMAWFYAANRSKHEWRVFTKDDQPQAQLTDEVPEKRPDQPRFTPKADKLHGASAFAAVDDGWLVGFNKGEFGATLYWFSHDGNRYYKISDHQIVDFFSLPNGIHAIEGLAHLGMSKGSVIHITRSKASNRWQANTVVQLPFAPYAISLRQDNTLLITLSDSLNIH